MKILIAAGGSGGHIFPSISLGRSLKNIDKKTEILYVGGDKSLDRRMFQKEGVRFSTLSSNKLPYKITPGIVPVLFRFLLDIFRSARIVIDFRPDVTVGFGGYVSFPVIFISHVMGVRTVVHEQNVVPGRANRSLFKWADKIAVSFRDTVDRVGRYKTKCVFTGNPIRADISRRDRSAAHRLFGLDEKAFTILVMGGSQGAAFLNRTFVDSIKRMGQSERSSLQVVHITGAKDYEWAIKAYEELGLESRVHSFVDRIDEAYAAADLVLTRAGSSAIFELALLRKPMILVPYPLANSHQLDNAKVTAAAGAAVLMEESRLDADVLRGVIDGLRNDGSRLKELSDAAGRFSVPGASDDLARETLNMNGRSDAR